MLSFTNNVAEASSAAEVRRGVSTASGLSMPQVHTALVRDGFEEHNQHFTANNPPWQPVRTSKRVYKKDHMFAALIPDSRGMPDEGMADDVMADDVLTNVEPMVQGGY